MWCFAAQYLMQADAGREQRPCFPGAEHKGFPGPEEMWSLGLVTAIWVAETELRVNLNQWGRLP